MHSGCFFSTHRLHREANARGGRTKRARLLLIGKAMGISLQSRQLCRGDAVRISAVGRDTDNDTAKHLAGWCVQVEALLFRRKCDEIYCCSYIRMELRCLSLPVIALLRVASSPAAIDAVSVAFLLSLVAEVAAFPDRYRPLPALLAARRAFLSPRRLRSAARIGFFRLAQSF